MQTLGLADSTPRSESRLKSLFWPAIQSGADVDYLGVQGYWLCTLFAAVTLLSSAMMGQPVAGILVCLFYYLSGVGIRDVVERQILALEDFRGRDTRALRNRAAIKRRGLMRILTVAQILDLVENQRQGGRESLGGDLMLPREIARDHGVISGGVRERLGGKSRA